jgi:threonine/homoserine/homoserine lactone efflux protein
VADAGAGQRGASVGARALFVTTALNPKALIFGLVLLPSPDRLAANLALFAGLVVLVAVSGPGSARRSDRRIRPAARDLRLAAAGVGLAGGDLGHPDRKGSGLSFGA